MNKERWRDKNFLMEQYTELGKSGLQIGRENNCCGPTIYYWLDVYEIPIRSGSEANKLRQNTPLQVERRRKLRERKTKVCSKCGIVKLAGKFNTFYRTINDKEYGPYLSSWCKKCLRKQYKERLKNDPDYNNNWCKKRKATNPKYKLDRYISTAIWNSLNGNKNGRHWETLVGYTLEDLWNHLESLFQSGMTWDNCGKWHIHHIKFICSFNYKTPEDKEFKECWALKNLQPVWAKLHRKMHKGIRKKRKQNITGQELCV